MSDGPSISQNARRMCIYIGESDRWRGKPLYIAILESLKTHGIAGATVLRGVAGFGAHSRIHTASILRLSEDLPLRIEIVDSPENIAKAMEKLSPMVREGLITLDDVQVVRYTHRYLNPLPAEKLVSEVMIKEVVTLDPDQTAAQAWGKMMETQIKAMPVVSKEGLVVGMITDEDILDRTGTLLMRLGFVERLDQKLLEDEFDRLKSNPVKISAIMSSPAVTVGVNESLAVAAGIMAKNKIKRLPVVHDDGRLAGVISRLDVLRQVIHEKPKKPKTLLPVGASRTVREIMLDDVPIIDQDADLGALVSAFVSHWYHRLIIVNEEGKAIGLVNDADVINRIHPSERRGVLKALQQRGPIPVSKYKAIDLMSAGVLKALPDTSVLDAIRMMVSQGRKWLVVVDSDDKPLGLVDRQTLLRAVTID